ncbi:MAG: hypothetical protein ACKVU1_02450 [bacterium]
MDRTAFAIVSFAEAEALDRAFWHSKTPIERLEAMEMIRQIFYGADYAAAGMQKVFEIDQLPYQ